jgi:hypothetical protein
MSAKIADCYVAAEQRGCGQTDDAVVVLEKAL